MELELNGIAGQDEFLMSRVQVVNWLLLAAMPLAAGFAFSWPMAGGTLIGALIANVSFMLLKNDLKKVLPGPLKAVKLRFFITYYLRLTALAALLYILVRYGHVHVFGLLVGLSAVALGILIAAVSKAKTFNLHLGKEAV